MPIASWLARWPLRERRPAFSTSGAMESSRSSPARGSFNRPAPEVEHAAGYGELDSVIEMAPEQRPYASQQLGQLGCLPA